MDDRCVYLNTTPGKVFITDASVFRENVKIKCKKKKISYNFPRWPVGVKSYQPCGTQVIAQSLKTRQQKGPEIEILQRQ